MTSNTDAKFTNTLETGNADYRPPAHPLDALWRIQNADGLFGPYTGHELMRFARDGIIDRGTRVARGDAEDWTEAGQDIVLARIFCSVKVPVSPARRMLS